MIGSFLTRGLLMVFGYAYPAYQCYKTVEMNKPDIQQLRFWCQYWILVAVFTFCERVCDVFISWLPVYYEAKLAFLIYLWYPKTQGTTYVYDAYFRPVVSEHEKEIDRNLLELRERAGDVMVLFWQKAFIFGQTRAYDIMKYIALQANRDQSSQIAIPDVLHFAQKQDANVGLHAGSPNPEQASKSLTAAGEPGIPTSIVPSDQKQDDVSGEMTPETPLLPSLIATAETKEVMHVTTLTLTTQSSSPSGTEGTENGSVPSLTKENAESNTIGVNEETIQGISAGATISS